MRALITGYSGFVGPYVARHLLECGDEVHGVLFEPGFRPPDFHRDVELKTHTVVCDLTDPAAVLALIRSVRPEAIYHMAAQSHVPMSWMKPAETFQANVIGTIHLLEAARQAAPDARILIVSSGDIYGAPDKDDIPLTESSTLRPANPYSVSKASQDQIAGVYAKAHGQAIVRVRPFNHTGPGQSPRFVCPAFAQQLARIKLGLSPARISVGDLTAQRDFLDVRDVCRAYRLALAQGLPGDVFNVASGQPRSAQFILDSLITLSGMEVTVQTDPDRYRPNDVPLICASAEALEKATGWRPEIPFERTLADLLDFFLKTER
jgi:GDP-4-dehydro-6-deoxy-D-mannose reductase